MNKVTRVAGNDRNSKTLHNYLWDLLEKIENDEITTQRARAASSVVGNIIATARLEIDYARFVADGRGLEKDGSRHKLVMGG